MLRPLVLFMLLAGSYVVVFMAMRPARPKFAPRPAAQAHIGADEYYAQLEQHRADRARQAAEAPAHAQLRVGRRTVDARVRSKRHIAVTYLFAERHGKIELILMRPPAAQDTATAGAQDTAGAAGGGDVPWPPRLDGCALAYDGVEAPKAVAARCLRARLGVAFDDLELLHRVRDARAARWDDGAGRSHESRVTSFVAMVLPRTEARVLAAGGGAGLAPTPLAELTGALVEQARLERAVADPYATDAFELPDTATRFSTWLAEDVEALHAFLRPFVLTSGKDPVKCLGPPPGGLKALAEDSFLKVMHRNT